MRLSLVTDHEYKHILANEPVNRHLAALELFQLPKDLSMVNYVQQAVTTLRRMLAYMHRLSSPHSSKSLCFQNLVTYLLLAEFARRHPENSL